MIKRYTLLLTTILIMTMPGLGQSWFDHLSQALCLDKPMCQDSMVVFNRGLGHYDDRLDTLFIDRNEPDYELAMRIIDSLPEYYIEDMILLNKLEIINDRFSARFLIQYGYLVDDFDPSRMLDSPWPRLFVYHENPYFIQARRVDRPNGFDVIESLEEASALIKVLQDPSLSVLDYIFVIKSGTKTLNKKSIVFRNNRHMGDGVFFKYYKKNKHKLMSKVKNLMNEEANSNHTLGSAIWLHYDYYSADLIDCADFEYLIDSNTYSGFVDMLKQVNENFHQLDCIDELVKKYYDEID